MAYRPLLCLQLLFENKHAHLDGEFGYIMQFISIDVGIKFHAVCPHMVNVVTRLKQTRAYRFKDYCLFF
jgi:hypothetical protein